MIIADVKHYSLIIAVLLCSAMSCSARKSSQAASAGDPLIFRGTCDASAAVALTDDLLLMADDENNVLRLYNANRGSLPIQQFDLTSFLDIEAEHPEADIEDAARIGNRIYWITSHGRNKDGKLRPNRYRFFATDFEINAGKVTLKPVGQPCKGLIHQIVSSSIGPQFGLDDATMFDADLSKKERAKLAPKERGLNIEALAASPDGGKLYIGLRNPLVATASGKRAIVMVLDNPSKVIEDGATANIAQVHLWDLGGRGLRSMEYSAHHKAFFIIAGPIDDETDFAFYRWSGAASESPTLINPIKSKLGDFKGEALVSFAGRGALLLLGDDGTIIVKVAGPTDCIDEDEYDSSTRSCQQKYLADSRRKSFRAMWLTPDDK